MLLGRPDENSPPTLRELATEHAWLRPPVDELMDLPLQEWQGNTQGCSSMAIRRLHALHLNPFIVMGVWRGPPAMSLSSSTPRRGFRDRSSRRITWGSCWSLQPLLLERRTPDADIQLKSLRDKHLSGWLPEFSERLQQETRSNSIALWASGYKSGSLHETGRGLLAAGTC